MKRLIISISNNDVIGIKNKLPWNIPSETSYFKRMTIGDNVVMGYNTYESIPFENGFPERNNYVISNRTPISIIEKNYWVRINTLNNILSMISNKDAWIIGGAKVADYFLKNGLIDEIYLTRVNTFIDNNDSVKFNINDYISNYEFLYNIDNRTYRLDDEYEYRITVYKKTKNN